MISVFIYTTRDIDVAFTINKSCQVGSLVNAQVPSITLRWTDGGGAEKLGFEIVRCHVCKIGCADDYFKQTKNTGF